LPVSVSGATLFCKRFVSTYESVTWVTDSAKPQTLADLELDTGALAC